MTSGQSLLNAAAVEYREVDTMSERELDLCFDLLSTNLKTAYEASSWGWHPVKKRLEMRDYRMRYLLLRSVALASGSVSIDAEKEDDVGGIAAFLSFMVTIEDDRLVTYVYEVQVDANYRGLGLGSILMDIVETLASRQSPRGPAAIVDGYLEEPDPLPPTDGHGTYTTMLTVFTSNTAARRFYERRGYQVDVISPEPRQTRQGVIECDYIIMSRPCPPAGRTTADVS